MHLGPLQCSRAGVGHLMGEAGRRWGRRASICCYWFSQLTQGGGSLPCSRQRLQGTPKGVLGWWWWEGRVPAPSFPLHFPQWPCHCQWTRHSMHLLPIVFSWSKAGSPGASPLPWVSWGQQCHGLPSAPALPVPHAVWEQAVERGTCPSGIPGQAWHPMLLLTKASKSSGLEEPWDSPTWVSWRQQRQ